MAAEWGQWGQRDVIDELAKMKYHKAVPQGRVQKEMWHMLCEGSYHCAQRVTEAFNLAWSRGVVPVTWQVSEGVQLDKHNGKEGLEGSV